VDALRALSGGGPGRTEAFELAFVDGDDGREIRQCLADCAGLRFEDVPPARRFPSYAGQRNYPGLYYAATMDRHVAFESWLERDQAMAMDFDPDIAGFAPQPFWLFWPGPGRVRSHVPDFFARTADGSGIVIDCRPADRVKPRDAEAFAATEQACEQAGWTFQLVTGHDGVWLDNVRWLAGYRHRRHHCEPAVSALTTVFRQPTPLAEGAYVAGDPVAVLPVLFHLLWLGLLSADLSQRLEATTMVTGRLG
jgi:hypothetical protein